MKIIKDGKIDKTGLIVTAVAITAGVGIILSVTISLSAMILEANRDDHEYVAEIEQEVVVGPQDVVHVNGKPVEKESRFEEVEPELSPHQQASSDALSILGYRISPEAISRYTELGVLEDEGSVVGVIKSSIKQAEVSGNYGTIHSGSSVNEKVGLRYGDTFRVKAIVDEVTTRHPVKESVLALGASVGEGAYKEIPPVELLLATAAIETRTSAALVRANITEVTSDTKRPNRGAFMSAVIEHSGTAQEDPLNIFKCDTGESLTGTEKFDNDWDCEKILEIGPQVKYKELRTGLKSGLYSSEAWPSKIKDPSKTLFTYTIQMSNRDEVYDSFIDQGLYKNEYLEIKDPLVFYGADTNDFDVVFISSGTVYRGSYTMLGGAPGMPLLTDLSKVVAPKK